MVGLGVFQVNVAERDVQVPAEDDGLLRVQRLQMRPERILPGHAVIQPLQAVLGVGGVAADEIKALKFGGNDPPLVVVLLQPQTVGHRERLDLGKDGHAGIPLLLCAVPKLMVPGQVQVDLPGVVLELGLLHAEDVRVQGGERRHKIFFHTSPQAVDVPGYEFHVLFSYG